MLKPPDGVKMTLEAVCLLMKTKPDWDSAKKVRLGIISIG